MQLNHARLAVYFLYEIENMANLANDNFLRALRKEPVDRTPIWVMRQAGRYLPEYRAIRAKAKSFMNLCQNPELACEVTLQPLARFDLDAAILFSDILTIPDALGLGLNFVEGEGPQFQRPLKTGADVDALATTYPEEKLRYVTDAMSLIKQTLAAKVPVIGFSGSPWTLACYMIEGKGSRDFASAKALRYTEPEIMHRLLLNLAQHIFNYLHAQLCAGADVLMLFDTWGGLLSSSDYKAFSLHYIYLFIKKLKATPEGADTPVILFTKGGGQWLEVIADSTQADGIGLDWTVDLAQAFQRVGDKVALQGNLDPTVLLSTPESIQAAVQEVMRAAAGRRGHIFNLGHGITPQVPVEHMQVLVDSVHNQR